MATIPKKDPRGKKRIFSDGNVLFNKFLAYIEHCHEIEYLPNVAGFCRYCDINRDTYYEQKNFYPDTIQKIEGILEDEALNSRAVNDTMKIFYMKNKFSNDYRDRHEVDVTERSYEVIG